MSFRYDVLLLLHCYSTMKPKDYIYIAQLVRLFLSFGYDVSVMILLRILILSKIITLTSYLKLTITTNEPSHIIYIYNHTLTLIMKVLHNSCNTVTCGLPDTSTLSPRACGPQALGVHIRQTMHLCLCYNY